MRYSSFYFCTHSLDMPEPNFYERPEMKNCTFHMSVRPPVTFPEMSAVCGVWVPTDEGGRWAGTLSTKPPKSQRKLTWSTSLSDWEKEQLEGGFTAMFLSSVAVKVS